jgi:hypothetical protein
VAQHTNKHLSKSHTQLSARFGVQKVEIGIVTSVDPVGNTCYVRLYGSQTNTIGPVPLGLGLAGSAAVGVTAKVILLEEANPSDAAIVALYGGHFAPITQRGIATVDLSSYQQAGAISFPSPFANAIDAVVATSRDPNYVASVSGESLSGFTLTVTRREGDSLVEGGAQAIAVANGAGSAGSSVTFGTAFANLTSVAAVCNLANWVAYVTGLSASGFTANVQGVNGAVGPVTVSVEYVAVGVPSVSASVPVDWVAFGR